jgi:integrase
MQSQTSQPKRRVRSRRYVGVYRSVSGKLEIQYRDEDGHNRFRSGDWTSELAASKARAEIIKRKDQGEPVKPTTSLIGEFAETWHAGLTDRPRTKDGYRYHLDKHLLPRFRRRKLPALTTDDVAKLVADMTAAGFKPWTIRGTLTTLSAMYQQAVRKRLVASNPVRGLEKKERPKLKQTRKRILDENEIRQLLANAGGYRPLIALLLFTGVRLGEALGLTWADIDTDEGFVRVREQLGRDRRRVELKTDSAVRDIVLVPQLASVLKQHKMASRFKRPEDYVFASPHGKGRDHRATARGIRRAVDRAKLRDGGKVTAHTLRHTYASMLIVGMGVDPVNVSKQLGHSDPATTLGVYSHEFEKARHADELRQGFGDRFGSLLARSS